MNSTLFEHSHGHVSRLSGLAWAVNCALAATLVAGCGGGTSQPPGSNLSGNTTVTILSTSTANDQLSKFILGTINSITLTDQEGNSVNLLAAPLSAEFIHANGTAEPLSTVSVPQGIYTSATMSIGGASFTCVGLIPSTGGLVTQQLAYGQLLPSQVTVNLPAPIAITGATMDLSLDLLVSQSARYSSCDGNPDQTYSITPAFNLTPVNFSAQPTNSANGKVVGIPGMIGSVDASGNGFVVNAIATYFDETSAGGPSWQVATSDSTVYQGIAGPSQLTAGMPVDMDAMVQENGSLLATRIAVYDTNTADLTVSSGPLLYENEYEPALVNFGAEGQGLLSGLNAFAYDFNGAVFQTSEQLTNVLNLPFAASFTAADMVAGQNILLTTHALTGSGGFPYAQAATLTLRPQAINGTVSAIGSDGGFTTYTVTLAPYDLFPALAVQEGQTTLLTDPNTVVVYADGSTQLLNTTPIAVGGVARFYGLVFNDNGTLRMDCAQILDGVAE